MARSMRGTKGLHCDDNDFVPNYGVKLSNIAEQFAKPKCGQVFLFLYNDSMSV